MSEVKKGNGLVYKNHPLRRVDNLIYYGSMADKYIVLLQILDTKKEQDMDVATRVSVQLQMTDPDLKSRDRVVKKSEKDSLYAAMDVGSIAMSQEAIVEAIAPRQFWNPFPKVRYTERPDVATACIMEGDVVVLVDNSASALLLPTTILRFNEEINDYYFPPLIGTYLQIIRTLVLLLTMFITPLWYLLVKNPDTLHENLRFLLVQDEYYVPLIVQLLLVELIIDILKIASLNTPDVLSNSFSMLGALILGDFAVQARWLVPEVLVYMAFVAVANYAQHSYEMGYATKLCRILLLVLIWLWDWWGFAAGIVITLMLIVTAKPLVGKGYLYPLIPFDRKKLARLLYRRPVTKKNS